MAKFSIVNSAKVGVLKGRIADLETQRDIYASRAQNWLDRAVEDEEVIDSLQIRLLSELKLRTTAASRTTTSPKGHFCVGLLLF